MQKLIIKLIKLYKIAISPVFGCCCRFQPTCSEYCIEAIQKKGVVIGLGYTIWRILRCQPFAKGGYDPVTTKKNN